MKTWPGLLLLLLAGCAEAPDPIAVQPRIARTDSLPLQSEVIPIPGGKERFVPDTSSHLIVLAASWCLPCRRQIDALRNGTLRTVYFLDDMPADSIAQLVDTLHTRVITGRAAQLFADSLGGVPSIPTTLIMKGGMIRYRVTGFRSEKELHELVTSR